MKAGFKKTSAGNIDFSEWSLAAMDDIKTKIDDVVAEIFTAACEDGARLEFPFIWGPEGDGDGGAPVTDPLTLQIELPIGLDEDTSPQWRVSLTDLLAKEISDLGEGFNDAERDLEILVAWRAELSNLIGKIDAATSKRRADA